MDAMRTAERLTALARVELLRGLSAAAIEALAADCRWREYDTGAAIIGQDDPDRDVYFVASGRVRVTFIAQNGREIAFRDLGEGASFGELSAIDGRMRSASVVALASTVLASVTREQFWLLLRAHASMTENLLKQLAKLIRDLTERVVDYSTLGVQNRIQAELVRMAREAGVSQNQAILAPIPRHADIASRVSTNREAVARELSQLARQGLIERHHDALVIHDVAQLLEMVDKVRGQ